MTFKDLLIKTRESKNMTKKQVAMLFDWTPMYYGRYENGYLKPKKANLKKFAEFLEIPEKKLESLLSHIE